MKVVGALVSLAALSHAAQLPLGAFNTALVAEGPLKHVHTGTGGFAGLQHDPPPKGAEAFRIPERMKPLGTFVDLVDGSRRTFVKYPGYKAGDADIVYELISHAAFPNYKLRLRKPSICDPDVVQYSGYLDISDDKHLFFWCVECYMIIPSTPLPRRVARRPQLLCFILRSFESRSNPSKSPLVLWLNGPSVFFGSRLL